VPLVRIDLLAGRPPELLRALIGNVHTTVATTLDVPEQSITIIVNEVPAEHWASAGATKAEQRQKAGS
jgi:4-oxalocrotonate tautomerase